MIRFLLLTGVASALSSAMFYPVAWRAVIVGLATSWAVLWTKSVPRIWADAFVVRGTVAGLTGGAAILTLGVVLQLCGVRWRSDLDFELKADSVSLMILPVVTTLTVLGVGWCCLHPKRARAWLTMLLALATASCLRGAFLVNLGSDGKGLVPMAVLLCLLVGAVPFAVLWLGAAWLAARLGWVPDKPHQ